MPMSIDIPSMSGADKVEPASALTGVANTNPPITRAVRNMNFVYVSICICIIPLGFEL